MHLEGMYPGTEVETTPSFPPSPHPHPHLGDRGPRKLAEQFVGPPEQGAQRETVIGRGPGLIHLVSTKKWVDFRVPSPIGRIQLTSVIGFQPEMRLGKQGVGSCGWLGPQQEPFPQNSARVASPTATRLAPFSLFAI